MKKYGVLALSVMIAFGVFAGKMEEYGGFKARNYQKGADGKLYTSAGKQVLDFTKDLTADQREEYIIAAKMASSGYTDSRYYDYDCTKNGNYYGDGKSTGYVEAKEQDLVNILNEASKNAKKDNKGTELYINKTTKIKGTDEYALMITGRGDSRLNARIFFKEGEDGKKTIGLVFGGTDGWKDAIDDVLNVASPVTPKPYKEAVELLQAVKAAYPDCDINVFGHSEGGGEAMFAVLSEGVHNGKGTVKYYGVNSAGLYGLKTNNDIKEGVITKEDIEQNFILIQNKDEKLGGILPVSEVAYQFGTVVLIPDMGDSFGFDENRRRTENTFTVRDGRKKGDVKKNLDGAHDITETLWKMTHCPVSNKEEEKKTTAQKEEDASPFNSDPEPEPDTPTPTETSVPSNTTQMRPSSPTRVRRGGGGDTSAIIWQKR